MTLANTAAAQRRSADRKPGHTYKYQLFRGLKLSIVRQENRLTLEAARLGVYPSDREAQIVAAVFFVPAGIAPVPLYDKKWDGLRWQWEEAAPPELPTIKQAPLFAE